ncbi:MAG TPA: hypothetical protein VH682_26940 [Gemmataceae bacterium]|jgi:hypothetical protein
MTDSPDQSPFAEFAAPKRSAVEEWRERQYQSRVARWKALRAAVCVFVGSASGATIGISLAVGFDRLAYVVSGAVVGGVLGLGAGVVVGCAGFSVMAMSGTRREPSFESGLARNDPMMVIKVLLVAWALIGLTVGSAWGGVEGSAWGERLAWRDSTFPWGFIGSVLGLALMGLVWLAWEARRRARMRARFLHGMTFAEQGDAAERPGE